MAKLLGYTQSAYSKIELGQNAPSPNTIQKMKEEAFVRPAWLMFGDGEKYVTEQEREEILADKKYSELRKQGLVPHPFADDEAARNLLDEEDDEKATILRGIDTALKSARSLEGELKSLRARLEKLL